MPNNYKYLTFWKKLNGNKKNLKWPFERMNNISTVWLNLYFLWWFDSRVLCSSNNVTVKMTSFETDEFTLIGVTSLLKSGSFSPHADIECYIKYKQIINNINKDKCKKKSKHIIRRCQWFLLTVDKSTFSSLLTTFAFCILE